MRAVVAGRAASGVHERQGLGLIADPATRAEQAGCLAAVRLIRHFKPDVDAFRCHALSLPEVVQLYHVAGPIDFLIHVWARDSDHLRELAMTAFTSREEVSHIETELIFEHIRSTELPAFAKPA